MAGLRFREIIYISRRNILDGVLPTPRNPKHNANDDGLRKIRAVFRVPSRGKWFRIHMQYIILTNFTTKN